MKGTTPASTALCWGNVSTRRRSRVNFGAWRFLRGRTLFSAPRRRHQSTFETHGLGFMTTSQAIGIGCVLTRRISIGILAPALSCTSAYGKAEVMKAKKAAALVPSMTEPEFENGYWYAVELKIFAENIGV